MTHDAPSPPPPDRDPRTDPLLRDVPEAEGHKILDDRYVLFAFSESHGVINQEVQMRPDGQTDLVLEFGDGSPLDLEVRDIDGGVAGVSTYVIPAGFIASAVIAKTDLAGQAHWPGVAHGEYSVHLDRYGYWSGYQTIQFEGQSPVTLSFRRRGNLSAVITNSAGSSLSSVHLDLHSVEFNTTVAAWLGDGKLEASAASLQSDAQGRVHATGIPHGVYRWTATAADGSTGFGEIIVPPGSTLDTSLQVGVQ